MTHAPYAQVKVETKTLESSMQARVKDYQQKSFRFLRTVEADKAHDSIGMSSVDETNIDVFSDTGFIDRLTLPEEALTDMPMQG